jgi:hypothetical protein
MRTNVTKLFVLLVFLTDICRAGNITYSVNLSVGAGSVMGDIVTDGNTGLLNPNADIVSFNLLLNDTVNTFDLVDGVDGTGEGFYGPSELTATPTELLYNFSGSDGLDFELNIDGSGGQFVCFESDSNCSGLPPGIALTASPEFANMQYTPLSGTQVIAEVSTPEPSTLALLISGIATIFAWRKLRKLA